MTTIDITPFLTDDLELPQFVTAEGKVLTIGEVRTLMEKLQTKVKEQALQLIHFQTDPIDSYESKQARNLKVALEQFLELVEPEDNKEIEPEG